MSAVGEIMQQKDSWGKSLFSIKKRRENSSVSLFSQKSRAFFEFPGVF